ncbi:MAG: carbohydrate ABC transporter permease [Oscillospiraceae bacterium]|nr:carbohydrate ABC transporter permease [Oscillospiraceae bacterium]
MNRIKPSRVFLYVFLIVYSLITLYPFLWALASSFKPLSDIVSGSLNPFHGNFTLNNYSYIITSDPNFLHWVINSFIIAISGTVINIFFNSLAGYSLARLEYPGRDLIFYLVLALIMVPGQVLLIPNFLVITKLGLINRLPSVILPMAANATYIFMMRQFFLSFPRSIEEAASLDGLGRFQVFLRIALPISMPAVATQGVFVFLGLWNNFQLPMLYLKSPSQYTLTVGIQSFQGQNINLWNYTIAGSILSIVPIIILYAILNKYFMIGMRLGGEK